MGASCYDCYKKEKYYSITKVLPQKTIKLTENVLVTSMLQLMNGKILCGDSKGTLTVYKINTEGTNYSIITKNNDQHNDNLIVSLCKLTNGIIVSASFDKLIIWEFSQDNLNVLNDEYSIDSDIDKVIALNGNNNKFAVGYTKEPQIIISIYEYNKTSPSKEPIQILTEEQKYTDTSLRSMLHLKYNDLLVSSYKNNSEGYLSFWNINTKKTHKRIPNLCTNASHGLIEFAPDLLIVASSNCKFVIVKLDTYEILQTIQDNKRDMFYPELISFSIFKKESLLYISHGKIGQLLIRGKESKLKYYFEHPEKFHGKGLIISSNEKYIIVDNNVNEDSEGAISILKLDFMIVNIDK